MGHEADAPMARCRQCTAPQHRGAALQKQREEQEGGLTVCRNPSVLQGLWQSLQGTGLRTCSDAERPQDAAMPPRQAWADGTEAA